MVLGSFASMLPRAMGSDAKAQAPGSRLFVGRVCQYLPPAMTQPRAVRLCEDDRPSGAVFGREELNNLPATRQSQQNRQLRVLDFELIDDLIVSRARWCSRRWTDAIEQGSANAPAPNTFSMVSGLLVIIECFMTCSFNIERQAGSVLRAFDNVIGGTACTSTSTLKQAFGLGV